MVAVEFRHADDGRAHVVENRQNVAVCGQITTGHADDSNAPCAECLVRAAQRTVELSDGEFVVDSPHLVSAR